MACVDIGKIPQPVKFESTVICYDLIQILIGG